MHIDFLTIFPDLIREAAAYGITGRAIRTGLVDVIAHDLRDFANDAHRTVDDTPYGGGAGMVFKPGPIARALAAVQDAGRSLEHVIFLTPDGHQLDQKTVNRLSIAPGLVLLCGRYRGIDERIRELYVTEEISVGDYVLSGGELPALVLMDAVVRLIPGGDGRRGIRPGGFIPERDSGLSVVYEAQGVRGVTGSRCSAERRPSADCRLAAPHGRAAHAETASGP